MGLGFFGYRLGYISTHEEVRQLQWINLANADEQYHKDIEAGRLRFYKFFGFGATIPEVDYDFVRPGCYIRVEITPLRGTSDSWINDVHLRLIFMAREFAERYNRLMKWHIDRTYPLRACRKFYARPPPEVSQIERLDDLMEDMESLRD